jgi:hypothetical protein
MAEDPVGHLLPGKPAIELVSPLPLLVKAQYPRG